MYVSLDKLIATDDLKMTDDQIESGLLALGYVEDEPWHAVDSGITINVSKRKSSQAENKISVSKHNSTFFSAQ